MSVERTTRSVLIELGANPGVKGFWYIVDAVQIILENDCRCDIRSEELNEAVAKKQCTSPRAVERAIRARVSQIYDSADWREILDNDWFSPDYAAGQLKPKQFLWALADYVDHIMSKENNDEGIDRDSEN